MPISGLRNILTIVILAGLVTGCDDRAAEIAREAADRQARQNEVMAELHSKVADGSRQLVEADALARQELVGVHRDLQSERGRLDAGWSDLQRQRSETSDRERAESLLAPLLKTAGAAALAALVLGFSWYALAAAGRGEPSEAEITELLLDELLSDAPPLELESRQPLPGPLRLEQPSEE